MTEQPDQPAAPREFGPEADEPAGAPVAIVIRRLEKKETTNASNSTGN
ncbi:hypothetical protein J2S46_002854 [Kitasatospora herbaricolor]|nr:hypothetical protein [Kitasatospora herbaricolor]MDQ0308298.1 hypothetical protein [Kitasatospora herbaricolor]